MHCNVGSLVEKYDVWTVPAMISDGDGGCQRPNWLLVKVFLMAINLPAECLCITTEATAGLAASVFNIR